MGNLKYHFDMNTETDSKIKLLSVTESSYENDWPSYKHSHAFTELFYVRGGRGSFLIEDEVFPIGKDDLIIINPNLSHTEISLGTVPLDYIVLAVEGLSFSFKEDRQYCIFNCSSRKDHLLFYFTSMLSELERKEDCYQEICCSMLNILTIHLKRMTGSAFDLVVAEAANKDVERVRRYMDSHYQDPLTLDFLAELSHLNKYYFLHLFTRSYGISPVNYLNERRIYISKELLLNTDHSIGEIAQLTGFSSQSYFSQSFKKSCHMTANAYRKSSKHT